MIAEPRIQDHLFLMAPRQSGKGVERAISTYQGSPQLWYQNLHQFLAEHGLDSVGISAIRKTMEGVVNRLFHGDIKARQALALHASAETTHGSYTTAENRQYYAEKIAEIQNAQIRWAATKGNADPRDQGYNKLSAVTLGFDCLDPYDSPITGQKARAALSGVWRMYSVSNWPTLIRPNRNHLLGYSNCRMQSR